LAVNRREIQKSPNHFAARRIVSITTRVYMPASSYERSCG
jgi:hypothetical protein